MHCKTKLGGIRPITMTISFNNFTAILASGLAARIIMHLEDFIFVLRGIWRKEKVSDYERLDCNDSSERG
jgi:hypothetical protein